MKYANDLPWMKIHDFLLYIENIREPKEFCIQVIKKMQSLVPYDQARVFVVNDNKKLDDKFSFGVEQKWDDMYLEYYSKVENGRYSIFQNMNYTIPNIDVRDWTTYQLDEFIVDYIKPQRLHYTLGFVLYCADNLTKSVYCLDRIGMNGYTDEELGILGIIQPHLDNLYMNSFLFSLSNRSYNHSESDMHLTKRETEIAELLRKGMTPANISNNLFLSLPTVYKHIANLHQKLNVSNRQELLLKLIDYSKIQKNL